MKTELRQKMLYLATIAIAAINTRYTVLVCGYLVDVRPLEQNPSIRATFSNGRILC